MELELGGYRNKLELLPDYRKSKTISYGHFSGWFQSGLRNAPIHTLNLSEDLQDYASSLQFADGIGSLESLIEARQGVLQEPWPPNLTVFLSNKVYENMECLQAWKQVPPAAIEHVLDTVRNRLLTFILELEERYPEAGEEDLSQGKEFPEEEVKQVFNTYILGSHNVVASGGSVTQTVEQTVAKGDFDSLKLVLKELGIGDADLEELSEAVQSDEKDASDQRLGPKVAAWLGNMVTKGASGVWNVGKPVATSLLTEALSRYYGLKQ